VRGLGRILPLLADKILPSMCTYELSYVQLDFLLGDEPNGARIYRTVARLFGTSDIANTPARRVAEASPTRGRELLIGCGLDR
jgi:hypothetical protein